MPYWMTDTLLATPAFLWVYLGVGVPFALALLPRPDWHDRPLVLMTAFAFGPGVLTSLMFGLGSFNVPLLTLPNVAGGLLVLNIGGVALAWYRWRTTSPPDTPPRTPLTPGETILIAMIAAAVLIRWVVMAYWPFTAYDALWVYGYEGRLYFLQGVIPPEIGYYPQFLPLQYTFGQLVSGQVNDSAARAVLPLLHIGSILAAYTLGARNFTRRTGIFLASLWALYPAVGVWARMGDLEIPLTFLITATATFFFMAWHGQRPRHYAALAGLIYGLALWTKPTAGAFALGVILLNVVELVRVRFDWGAYRPRFTVSAITALFCAPLGGAWYLRNIALGHAAVDFPPQYWHSLAERGGGQFLWYGVGLLVLFAYLTYTRRANWMMGAGVALVLLGVAPSALARFLDVTPGAVWTQVYPSLVGLPRLGWLEGACLLGGVIVLAAAFRRNFDLRTLPPDAAKVGWMLAVTLPYFAVFFWLYSYHYRLAFAIVPLMAVPTAVVLARWFPNADVRAWGGGRRWLFTGAVILLALPGVVLPLRDNFLGWDYLWNSELTDDTAKRTSGNEALMWMVDGFRIYEQEHGEPPVIAAPGVQRLPFFFPLADIRIDEAPTRLSELDGVTYFVDSHPDGTGAYERKGVPLLQNQVLSALGRQDILRRAWWRDDGIFRYEIYELHLANRFEPKDPLGTAEGDVVFGGFARFLGHEISTRTFQIGQRRTVKFYWEVLDEASGDYMTYIHLRDAEDNLQMAWDGPVSRTEDGRYYTTLVWEPGEYIVDDRLLQLTNFDAPVGEGYSIVMGLYDLTTGERVPVTQDGVPIGDGYRLSEPITVTPPQPDSND